MKRYSEIIIPGSIVLGGSFFVFCSRFIRDVGVEEKTGKLVKGADPSPKMSQLPSDTKQDVNLALTAETSINTAWYSLVSLGKKPE